jgi:hypothetical protein
MTRLLRLDLATVERVVRLRRLQSGNSPRAFRGAWVSPDFECQKSRVRIAHHPNMPSTAGTD